MTADEPRPSSLAKPTFDSEILPIREMERRCARWELQQVGGNQLRTAERLGVDRKTLAKWIADDESE